MLVHFWRMQCRIFFLMVVGLLLVVLLSFRIVFLIYCIKLFLWLIYHFFFNFYTFIIKYILIEKYDNKHFKDWFLHNHTLIINLIWYFWKYKIKDRYRPVSYPLLDDRNKVYVVIFYTSELIIIIIIINIKKFCTFFKLIITIYKILFNK